MIKKEIEKIKKYAGQTYDFLSQKKVITIMVVVAMIILLIWTSWIRLENLPLLKDSTTGEYIPLALDPFYFLNHAITNYNKTCTHISNLCFKLLL